PTAAPAGRRRGSRAAPGAGRACGARAARTPPARGRAPRTCPRDRRSSRETSVGGGRCRGRPGRAGYGTAADARTSSGVEVKHAVRDRTRAASGPHRVPGPHRGRTRKDRDRTVGCPGRQPAGAAPEGIPVRRPRNAPGAAAPGRSRCSRPGNNRGLPPVPYRQGGARAAHVRHVQPRGPTPHDRPTRTTDLPRHRRHPTVAADDTAADEIRGTALGSAPVPLSVLDLVTVGAGSTATDALRTSVELARLAESRGFHRHWVAEHHSMPGVASSSPAVILAHLAAHTSRIRLGSGGVMLPNHAPLVIAEQFGTLEALAPGRIDLGLGRAPGTDGATAAALRRTDRLNEGADDFPQQLAELTRFLDDDF